MARLCGEMYRDGAALDVSQPVRPDFRGELAAVARETRLAEENGTAEMEKALAILDPAPAADGRKP